MADYTLYTNPMSRGRIARWMCEEVGVPYDTVLLEYGTTMKAPEYLAINPMGKVPAIKHGDAVVTEAAAICAYLAEAFPKAGLAPQANERAAYYRWMFFAAGPVEAAVTDASRGITPKGEEQGRVGYGSLDHVTDALEGHFKAHDFVTGDRFTAADVYVGSEISWGLMFKTIEARPALVAYTERFNNRPAAVRAREIDDALMAKAQEKSKDA